MVIEDLKKWEKFRQGTGSTITHEEYLFVCNLHAKSFNHKLELPCKCNPKRLNIMIADINKLYDKQF